MEWKGKGELKNTQGESTYEIPLMIFPCWFLMFSIFPVFLSVMEEGKIKFFLIKKNELFTFNFLKISG